MVQQDTRPVELSPFGAEVERLCRDKGLSARQLADRVFVTPSWLSKLKRARVVPPDVARRCDEALDARGRLIALAESQGGVRPAQLPGVTARFVGRDTELRGVTATLAGWTRVGIPVVVAIDGAPGVGKTMVALRAAHDVAELFPDGQLYADLHGYTPNATPVDPTRVLEEFLTALGVPGPTIPGGVDDRAALYRSVVADKRILVVLDNAASSGQVLPLLPGAQGCGVVVTSRRRLGALAARAGGTQFTLEPMTGSDADRLLREVIGAERVDTEPGAATELARLCDYLPLALQAAAERIVADPQLRLGDLVAELANAEHPLDSLQAGDLAVRAVFSWSMRDLDAQVAHTFRMLGLHPGPTISAEAVAALTGLGISTSRRALKDLADAHLIDAAAGYHRLGGLVRSFAIERAQAELSDPDRRAARARLISWYLHTAAVANRLLAPARLSPLQLPPLAPDVRPTSFASDIEARQWCQDELPNLVAITELAAHDGDTRLAEAAWQLPLALTSYFQLRKPGRAWIQTHETALVAARSLNDRAAEGQVATNLADGLRWQRQYRRAADLYTTALAILREIGDRHGQAQVLAGMALLALDRGDLTAALSYCQQALPEFRHAGDRYGQAQILAAFGDVHRARGELDDALHTFREALSICLDINDQPAQATMLRKIATVYAARGDSPRALGNLDQSQAVCRRCGDLWGEADTLHRQGALLHQMGDPRRAREAWSAALRLFDDLGDPRAADVRSLLVGDNARMTSRDPADIHTPHDQPGVIEVEPEIDPTKPAAARIYDFFLDGSANFDADRRMARRLEANNPDTKHVAMQQRAWLRRAVTYLRLQGIRQFLDIGSGIPTVGNVHQIAQRDDPAVRVVYVDNDPVAYHHSRTILRDEANTYAAVIHADLRDPASILDHPKLRGMLDLTQPVALILAAVLPFIGDQHHPADLVAHLRDALTPGSWLALNHLTYSGQPPAARATARAAEDMYQQAVTVNLTLRSRDQITSFFNGWDILDPPGLTWISTWHPNAPGMPPREISDLAPHRSWSLGALARLTQARGTTSG